MASKMATWALVLSIISIVLLFAFFIGFPIAIVALILGIKTLKSDRNMAIAAVVLSSVTIILGLIGGILFMTVMSPSAQVEEHVNTLQYYESELESVLEQLGVLFDSDLAFDTQSDIVATKTMMLDMMELNTQARELIEDINYEIDAIVALDSDYEEFAQQVREGYDTYMKFTLVLDEVIQEFIPFLDWSLEFKKMTKHMEKVSMQEDLLPGYKITKNYDGVEKISATILDEVAGAQAAINAAEEIKHFPFMTKLQTSLEHLEKYYISVKVGASVNNLDVSDHEETLAYNALPSGDEIETQIEEVTSSVYEKIELLEQYSDDAEQIFAEVYGE